MTDWSSKEEVAGIAKNLALRGDRRSSDSIVLWIRHEVSIIWEDEMRVQDFVMSKLLGRDSAGLVHISIRLLDTFNISYSVYIHIRIRRAIAHAVRWFIRAI